MESEAVNSSQQSNNPRLQHSIQFNRRALNIKSYFPKISLQKQGRRVILAAFKSEERMAVKIFNYLSYYVGWLACVYGAAQGQSAIGVAVAALLVLIHFVLTHTLREEIMMIVLVGVLGTCVDSFQAASGLLVYHAGYAKLPWFAPIWITAIWVLFASTINWSFEWLKGRTWLTVVLGAIGGPLTYAAGERIGAVRFQYDYALTMLALAAIWSLVLPAFFALAHRMTRLPHAR